MPEWKLSSIRLVVFDMDGTLVDAFEDIHRSTCHALRPMGREPLDFATVKSYVGDGARKLLERAFRTTDSATIGQAIEHWREFANAHPAERSRLYPGAIEALRQLERLGVKRAVLSNKVHDLTQEIARRLGLDDWLDAIWGERAEFGCKPDPRGLQAMMAELGEEPARTLMVGDGLPDMQVARAAGARACGALWGIHTREELAREAPDMMADSLDALRSAFAEAHGAE